MCLDHKHVSSTLGDQDGSRHDTAALDEEVGWRWLQGVPECLVKLGDNISLPGNTNYKIMPSTILINVLN